MLTSFQSISNTSQIQFFLNLIFSGDNLPLILNKCILPAILHRIIGTYDCVFDIKSITLVMLENKCPPNKIGVFDPVGDKIHHFIYVCSALSLHNHISSGSLFFAHLGRILRDLICSNNSNQSFL